MRRSVAVMAVASLAVVATIVAYSVSARSSDHQDAPGTKANPTSDIDDLYAWVDGNNLVLVMTTNPGATSSTLFDNTVQYVFHTASAATYTGPIPQTGGVDVIATFDTSTPQNISLWVGGSEYVTGNASGTGGITSPDGKVKVFAGPRADPFFFNLDGFHTAVADIVSAEPSLVTAHAFNEAGCPQLGATTSDALVSQLGTNPQAGAPVNHFATLDSLAVVVSVDKSLVTAHGSSLSVWAATYTIAGKGGE